MASTKESLCDKQTHDMSERLPLFSATDPDNARLDRTDNRRESCHLQVNALRINCECWRVGSGGIADPQAVHYVGVVHIEAFGTISESQSALRTEKVCSQAFRPKAEQFHAATDATVTFIEEAIHGLT